ncbi:MAG: hypothetical protein K6F56_07765 [Oscillospiraceae bacterium]|nr:hypothetical protein [Oscillospiraceae bacterium]
MRRGWKIILVIVAVCIAFGIVSAGVGTLTGADPERIGSILEERIAERNNIDLDALIFEWVPEVIDTVEQQLGIAK